MSFMSSPLSIDDENNTSSEIDFSVLSLDLNDTSIEDTQESTSLKSVETGFCLKSNLSVNNDGNVSTSYSVSFDEPAVETPVCRLKKNSKRKIKNAPKFSTPSANLSCYSPLATDLLNSSTRQRFSDKFRADIYELNSNGTKEKVSMGSISDKDLSFIHDVSLSDKENLSALSIDDISPGPCKNKATRFSEHFRKELSQLHISSPDISFDMPNLSPNQNNLSLELSSSLPESPHELNYKFSKDTRFKKESDEDELNLVTPAHSKCHKNRLESSDEESDDELLDDSLSHDQSLQYECSTNVGSESDSDEQYENSFIDDEAMEGEETPDEDEKRETSIESSDDDLMTALDGHLTKFVTPRIRKEPTETNMYNTPTTFCYSDVPDRNKERRRRTCLATPLSVNTKTGTPGQPNRTYNRNILTAARELFEQFNEYVFGNQLPADLEIKVNKRLNTTAGRCVYIRKGKLHYAYIELSSKVVDCLERLKETLAHELCHAAAFIIDGKMDNHGPIWKQWASRVNTKYPELPPVSRCHTYQIQYKHNYKCSEDWCQYKIGRHSKSIDLQKSLCPLCYSKLLLIDNGKSSATTNTKWTEFVKTKYNEIKENQPPKTPHKDIMKVLSHEFKNVKLQGTV